MSIQLQPFVHLCCTAPHQPLFLCYSAPPCQLPPPLPPSPPVQLLNPVVEGILQADMVRFKDYAAAHLANTKA